jgi:hypothetical protein
MVVGQRVTTFDTHWKRMEIWVGLLMQTIEQATISRLFFENYRCPNAWHPPNTLHTMVHGPISIIIWYHTTPTPPQVKKNRADFHLSATRGRFIV